MYCLNIYGNKQNKYVCICSIYTYILYLNKLKRSLSYNK